MADSAAPWECNRCSFQNSGSLSLCEMCESPRIHYLHENTPAAPKMTPLVMPNYKDKGDREREKEKEKETDEGTGGSLSAQLKNAKEAMDVLKQSEMLKEEKLKALLTFSKAVCSGDAEAARFFLENFEPEDLEDSGALHAAAKAGHLEVVKVLVDHKYDVNLLGFQLLPATPLSLAAAEGHVEVVKYLLEKGADVTQYNKDETGPLYHAIKNGHVEIVEILLTHEASLVHGYAGSTPLIVACENAQFEIADIILSKKVDVNQVGGEKKCTPLHAAAKTGRLPLIAMLLLQPGIIVDVQDKDGRVALQYALQTGTQVHSNVEELMAYKESLPDQLMEIVNQARKGENIENEEREKKEEEKEKEKEKDRKSKRKEEDAVVHNKNEEQSKAVDSSKSSTTTEGKEKEKEKEPTQPQTTTDTTHSRRPNKEEGHHVVIKLQDAKGDLRRFSLPIGEKNAGTFWHLFGLLEAELKIKEELSVHSSGLFQLKYIDDEGDKITILTGEDLAEAIRCVESKPTQLSRHVLRLYLK